MFFDDDAIAQAARDLDPMAFVWALIIIAVIGGLLVW